MADDISTLTRLYCIRAKVATDIKQPSATASGSLNVATSTAALLAGMEVSGPGIHRCAKIAAIVDGSNFTLTIAAYATNGTATLTFSSVDAQIEFLQSRLTGTGGLMDEVDAGDFAMTQLQLEGGSGMGERGVSAQQRAIAIMDAIDELTGSRLAPRSLTPRFRSIPL